MSASLRSCNFGAGYAGTATVGYRLYDKNGVAQGSRITAGVTELGTNTGIFISDVDTPDTETIVLWDTGGATPRYGIAENDYQLNAIQAETDNIRKIWNSLKNQSDVYTKILESVKELKELSQVKESPVFVTKLEGLTKLIGDLKIPTADELAGKIKLPAPVVNIPKPVVNLPAPIVNIPKTIIPDYTDELLQLRKSLMGIDGKVSAIPLNHNDITAPLNQLIAGLDKSVKTLMDEFSFRLINLTDRMSKELENKTHTKAEKSDIANIIKQAQLILSTFQNNQRYMQSLISAIDNGMVSKVKTGYMDAVNEKRSALSNMRKKRTNDSILLGLGIKNG